MPPTDNLALNFARKKKDIQNNIMTLDQDNTISSTSPEAHLRIEGGIDSPMPQSELLLNTEEVPSPGLATERGVRGLEMKGSN